MFKTSKSLFIAMIMVSSFYIFTNANAATITFADYFSGLSGSDKWEYVDTNGRRFTWTLATIVDGPNAGRMKLGNNTSGIVFDVVNNVVTWYEIDGEMINPPVVFAETHNTDEVVIIYSNEVVLKVLPSMTVAAGTYNDVLAMIWLDSDYAANAKNDELGLGGITASAVTDVDYFVIDVGYLKHEPISAATGTKPTDGIGWELANITQDSTLSVSGGDSGGGAMNLMFLLPMFLIGILAGRLRV